jgi:N-sulfoglucosamine sulfohydrolase
MKYFIALLIIAIVGFTSCTSERKVKPNIVWILAEDLSQDIGCYGNELVLTPTLDQMASEGIRFENVFVTGPVCTPSRTALATGMYQTSINAHQMRYPEELKNPLPDDVLPINELLRRSGYQTANIKDKPGTGKTDWSFKSDVAAYDYNSWNDIKPGKPFFAVVNLRLTHRPFEKDPQNPIDPATVNLPPYYPDNIVARKDFADYLESVQLLDGQVEQILEELQKRGWAENTIVFFFGDHGRPFTRGKTFLYDSGIKIPLILTCPDGLDWQQYLPKNSTNNQLISTIDISATTLAIAEVPKPESLQGRIIFGPNKEPERKYIFSAADRSGEIYFKSRSVRDKRFKYIKNYHHDFSVNEASTAYRRAMHPIYQLLEIMDERNELDAIQKKLVMPLPEEELYDIQADPFEINNLAKDPDHQQDLERMKNELATWQKETMDFGMIEDSPELEKAFEEYGVQSASKYQSKAEKLRNEIEKDLNPE